MKRNLFLSISALALLFVIGCGTEDEKANLSFKNSTNSDGKINDIVWADGNATWNSATGYDLGATTEQKEVSKLTGDVTATVDDSGDIGVAIIDIEGVDSQTLSLADGSTNTFTLKATSSLSSPKKK